MSRIEESSPTADPATTDPYEARLLCGSMLILVGIAALIAADDSSIPYLATGWTMIAGASLAAVGTLLAASSLAARGVRVARAVFVAVPGALLAVICYTWRTYFVTYADSGSYEATTFALAFGFYFGWLWAIAGPILVHRARTKLRRQNAPVLRGFDPAQAATIARGNRSLVIATYLAACIVLVGSIVLASTAK